jgi:mono/diheme cytochrome c family protein
MKTLRAIVFALTVAAGVAYAGWAADPRRPIAERAATPGVINERWIVEGEKRYRVHCGRCHQPPHRFEPRVMATVVRHMRVRAMLTDEDMKYVLYYMTH